MIWQFNGAMGVDVGSDRGLTEVLAGIARASPAELVGSRLADIRRTAFHLELILAEKGRDVVVCDLGGGLGFFSLGCAALGMRAILVDDFRDERVEGLYDQVLDLLRRYGVEVVRRDVSEEGIDFAADSIDVVTCFEMIEHLHHSPKRLFAQVRRVLKPGGLFILAAPNCMNLRKRLTTLLGRGSWSTMAHWYESERFRGHVREPSVADLRYIARDMGLSRVRIIGRNWQGYAGRPGVRALTHLADPLLKLRPSLCSNIYLLGVKEDRAADLPASRDSA